MHLYKFRNAVENWEDVAIFIRDREIEQFEKADESEKVKFLMGHKTRWVRSTLSEHDRPSTKAESLTSLPKDRERMMKHHGDKVMIHGITETFNEEITEEDYLKTVGGILSIMPTSWGMKVASGVLIDTAQRRFGPTTASKVADVLMMMKVLVEADEPSIKKVLNIRDEDGCSIPVMALLAKFNDVEADTPEQRLDLLLNELKKMAG